MYHHPSLLFLPLVYNYWTIVLNNTQSSIFFFVLRTLSTQCPTVCNQDWFRSHFVITNRSARHGSLSVHRVSSCVSSSHPPIVTLPPCFCILTMLLITRFCRSETSRSNQIVQIVSLIVLLSGLDETFITRRNYPDKIFELVIVTNWTGQRLVLPRLD